MILEFLLNTLMILAIVIVISIIALIIANLYVEIKKITKKGD